MIASNWYPTGTGPHVSGQIGTIPITVFRPLGGIPLQNTTAFGCYKFAQWQTNSFTMILIHSFTMKVYIGSCVSNMFVKQLGFPARYSCCNPTFQATLRSPCLSGCLRSSDAMNGPGMRVSWLHRWYLRPYRPTPGAYPKPPTNSLWFGIPFIWGWKGMSGVCSRGMLGFP